MIQVFLVIEWLAGVHPCASVEKAKANERVLRPRPVGPNGPFSIGAAPQTPQIQQQKQRLPYESGVLLKVWAND